MEIKGNSPTEPNKTNSQGAFLSPETKTNNTNYKDVFLLPDDSTLNKMSEIQHLELYLNLIGPLTVELAALEHLKYPYRFTMSLRYVNTIQAHCRNFIRVGDQKDGGKEICVDEAYKPKAPCLVYSFGIGNIWDFDNMAVELFGCEVHCFDPSIHVTRADVFRATQRNVLRVAREKYLVIAQGLPNMRKKSGRVSDKIWFYDVGLSDQDGPDKRNWTFKTLSTIKKELNHEDRDIDILKIDVEGFEWKSIIQMIKSGALRDVKQMAVELHFPGRARDMPEGWRDGDTNIHLSCLRQLYNAGFRIVMKDRNIFGGNVQKWPQFKHPLTVLYEVTIVNMKYRNK